VLQGDWREVCCDTAAITPPWSLFVTVSKDGHQLFPRVDVGAFSLAQRTAALQRRPGRGGVGRTVFVGGKCIILRTCVHVQMQTCVQTARTLEIFGVGPRFFHNKKQTTRKIIMHDDIFFESYCFFFQDMGPGHGSVASSLCA